MKHIDKDFILTVKLMDGSTIKINMPVFFPATQTDCKKLAKIIDEAEAPDEIKAECIEYLNRVVKDLVLRTRNAATITKYFKNITAIGGKDMAKNSERELAETLIALKDERLKVADREERLKEAIVDMQNVGKVNAENANGLLERLNDKMKEADKYREMMQKARVEAAAYAEKAKNLETKAAKLQEELDELKAVKPVIALQDAPDNTKDAPDDTKNANENKPETLQDLIKVSGVTLQINGRKTTSPVSWIYGADAYKELLERLGFKYSRKKAGYWLKGIAA